MIKNKELNILYSYLRECENVQVYSNNKLDEKINPIINNIKQYERPDLYSIVDTEIFIIEHFEFDSYNSNKKGSDYRWKEGNIQNDFEKLLSENLDREIIHNSVLNSTASVNNYIDNFIKKFNNHYKKIDIYKSRINMIHSGTIRTCFFVEDVSPLGSYYINKNRFPKLLFIFQFKKIIDFLLSHPNVFAMFYGYFDGNKKRLMVIENNQKSLEKFVADHGFVDGSECYWIEPNVSGFSFPIFNIEE